MCNIFDMPREWAEDDKQNEADAFAEAIKRIKPVDNIHTAYQRGYEAGYKAAEDRIIHCMEVPTRAAAKLGEENEQLKKEVEYLRAAVKRSCEEDYNV
jgi:flagellar biosynthesis/type III secretory pathway protein FliH